MKSENRKSLYHKGLVCALACSVLWGVLPIYWQSLRPIESSVIIYYRIFLVGLVCIITSMKMYGIDEIRKHLRPKGAKLKFFAAGLLITANWSIYIWAVNAEHVIQTCVGYYIEPLMVSVFGIIFFREKLTKYKLTALAMASAGVVVMLVHFKEVPLIALGLALTFATYAALKKSFHLPSVLSLLYETMFLMLPALAVIIYLEATGQGAVGAGEPYQYGLLMLCGPITALTLIFFAEAANKVPLVTLGILEYISPSLSLIIGVFLFREPFDSVQFAAFVIVWIGLAVFTAGEKKESDLMEKEQAEMFDVFGEGYDRFAFPDSMIHRVTAGHGGEALLIEGSEKTALIDCGMAYCGRDMVNNLKRILGECGRVTLDYVILSHSHYDHIGALPYVREAFPDAVVCGSRKCRDILIRPNARKLMKELGTAARDLYRPESTEEIPVETLAVDRVLKDGEEISLGNEKIVVLETKGHTDCSLSFALEPLRLLFTSESTGILVSKDFLHTPVLKDFNDAGVSLEKCRAYGAEYVCLPHFGMLPQDFIGKYWDMFEFFCHEKINFVRELRDSGKTEKEILDCYVDKYWQPEMIEEQPKEAYIVNCRAIVKAILRSI